MHYIAILVIILITTFDIILARLNFLNRHQPIPSNVKDVYDETSYMKWLQYSMEHFKVNIYSKLINALVLIAMIATSAFSELTTLTSRLSASQVFEPILYLLICASGYYLLNIGFSIYKTFYIEQKYGFNTTTAKTYILDQLKNILLLGSLAFGVLSFILNIYLGIGLLSFFYIWLFLIAVLFVINILYVHVFIRLFNKLTPLSEGDLYEKSRALAKSLGYEIKSISVMNASKRSTKLNAFFTGFGRFKKVVLYDTLIEKCTTDEIVSVLAHEIGHAKHKDTLRSLIETCIEMIIYLTVLAGIFTIPALYRDFGFSEIHLGFAFILFLIFFRPFQTIINIPLMKLSRRAEFRADACAADSGYKDAMISALKTLSRENFSNLTPHPLYVTMHYTHPPTSSRIEALEKH